MAHRPLVWLLVASSGSFGCSVFEDVDALDQGCGPGTVASGGKCVDSAGADAAVDATTLAGDASIDAGAGLDAANGDASDGAANGDASDDDAEGGSGILSWSGFDWIIKEGDGLGPGPNHWRRTNVFVDAQGLLHLQINQENGNWTCVELYTNQPYSFGTYQWSVDGRVDLLDQNVVLGLFNYGPPAVGVDGTNEIDFEFTRFGQATNDNLSWTVYPDYGNVVAQSTRTFTLDGTYTTARMQWLSGSVDFYLMGGFLDISAPEANVIDSWSNDGTTDDGGVDAAAASLVNTPQSPLPLHMSLWLFHGDAPVDGKAVEVLIHEFGIKI